MVSREYESVQCAINSHAITPYKGDGRGREDDFDGHVSAVMKAYGELRNLKGFSGIAHNDSDIIEKFRKVQEDLAKAGRAALLFLLARWKAEDVCGIDELTPEDKKTVPEPPVRFGEEFLCMLYANFILVVLIRIRSLVVATSGLYILTLLAVSVYPFEPKTVIRWVMILVLLYIIGVVAFVYAAMHRDSTLSYMTDTTPGELGAAFWVRMASFVILPIVSLVVAQFPELSNLVFSWIQPGLQSLGK